ncbi:hypothetical protein HYH02_011453 [Chlamydomonas schloesseri]|uniref:Uncharacterized protein n=1 Tax=Chlamydomonas schloesseri TaxID=2026947 RepID=A0A835W1E6_9CHLO|nr:hypothetical protein HYH02_011453 [Chlamydomonas schloesseri]|eukprot:KAG2437022.1 hypothetical protein HYH02_011453 [Chlamydomonas schloesseri]
MRAGDCNTVSKDVPDFTNALQIRLLPDDWDDERVAQEETAALYYANFISNKMQNVDYRFGPATWVSLGMQPVPEWLVVKCFQAANTKESNVFHSLTETFGVFGT